MRKEIVDVMERLSASPVKQGQELVGQLGLVLERSVLGSKYKFNIEDQHFYAEELPKNLLDAWLSPTELGELADYLATLLSETGYRTTALWALSKAPSEYGLAGILTALEQSDATWDDDAIFQLLVALRNMATHETVKELVRRGVRSKSAEVAANRGSKVRELSDQLVTFISRLTASGGARDNDPHQ